MAMGYSGDGCLAASVGTYFMVDAAATSEDASQVQPNGRVSLSRAEYEDARSSHTMGTAIMWIGSTITVSGLAWLIFSDSDSTSSADRTAKNECNLESHPRRSIWEVHSK